MLYREIIAVCSQIHTKKTHTHIYMYVYIYIYIYIYIHIYTYTVWEERRICES